MKAFAGKLAIPPCLLSRRKEFRYAIENPEKKFAFPLGPYDLFIRIFRKKKTMQQKLKEENQSLKKELLEIKKALSEMQKQQQEKERLLEHIVESDKVELPSRKVGPLSAELKRSVSVNIAPGKKLKTSRKKKMKSNEIESKEQRERDINSKVKELRAAVDKAEKRVSLAPDHKELALAKVDNVMEAIHKKFFDPDFG